MQTPFIMLKKVEISALIFTAHLAYLCLDSMEWTQ